MNDHILIPRPAAVPTPAELVGYLLQRGWQRTSGDEAWLQLARIDDPESVVEVPQRSLAPDYPRAAHTLLDDLSRLERRPAAAILRDVKSVALDCVRIAVESDATRDGRIGVEAGRRVYAAARDMYLAAACAVDEPRPAFPRRKTSAVMDTLERARFGQTEVGSFVLTIESEIPQRLRGDDPQTTKRRASA
jgi:hypothetical protein